MILEKNFSAQTKTPLLNNDNLSNNNYNQMDISDNFNPNSTSDKNIFYPIKEISQKIIELSKNIRIICFIINDLKFLNTENKRNKMFKLLQTSNDDFDVFKLIEPLEDVYFYIMISDLLNFVNNLIWNFKEESKMLVSNIFIKNISEITNLNKNEMIVKHLIALIESSIKISKDFDYQIINDDNFLSVLSHTITNYKTYESKFVEYALIVLHDMLKYFRENDKIVYRNIIGFLEENKTNLRIDEMCTLNVSEIVSKLSTLILKENWEVMDIYLQSQTLSKMK